MWRDFGDGPGRSRAALARACGMARPPATLSCKASGILAAIRTQVRLCPDTQEKMARVKVYRFKCYDITREEQLHSARWGTLEAIDTIERCIALKDTVTEVDEDLLDAQGFLHGEPPG